MFYKSKYDIIEKGSFTCSMHLLFLASKIAKDMKSLDNGKIDKSTFNDNFNMTIEKGIPSIKTIAHIGYENSKDLSKIKQEVLKSYILNEGLTLDEFKSNYTRLVNTYVKIILAFGILEKEDISIYRVITPEVLFGLIKGNFVLMKEAVDKMGLTVSDESKNLMEKLVNPKSKIEDLNGDEKKILNSEHSKFMKEKITSYVKKESSTQEVLKFSKYLGKKKSVLEL